jgi:hypothetical protein
VIREISWQETVTGKKIGGQKLKIKQAVGRITEVTAIEEPHFGAFF